MTITSTCYVGPLHDTLRAGESLGQQNVVLEHRGLADVLRDAVLVRGGVVSQVQRVLVHALLQQVYR